VVVIGRASIVEYNLLTLEKAKTHFRRFVGCATTRRRTTTRSSVRGYRNLVITLRTPALTG